MENKTMGKPIYKTGDKIKIINYGHLMWVSKAMYQEQRKAVHAMEHRHNVREMQLAFGKDCKVPTMPKYIADPNAMPKNVIAEFDNIWWTDVAPHKLGRKDTIKQVKSVQGIPHYSLVSGGAWYVEEQLELLK